jgi:hypothetical protein
MLSASGHPNRREVIKLIDRLWQRAKVASPSPDPGLSGMVEKLRGLHAKATEPHPRPVEGDGSRIGEVGAARKDDENRKRWLERVNAARAELVNEIPAILARLSAAPLPVTRIEEQARLRDIADKLERDATEHMATYGAPEDIDDTANWAASELREIAEALTTPVAVEGDERAVKYGSPSMRDRARKAARSVIDKLSTNERALVEAWANVEFWAGKLAALRPVAEEGGETK